MPTSTPIHCIVSLQDGRWAANSLYKIVIWKYKERKRDNIVYVEGHDKEVSSLIQLRDGRFLSGSDDKKIFLWNWEDNSRWREIEGHKGPVLSLFQMKEGNWVSGDKYSEIFIWNLDITEILQVIIEEGSILAFHQWNNYDFCSITSASEVKIWSK